MSENDPTDEEYAWHAEIFYSLTQNDVTVAELQEIAGQAPMSVGSLRHDKICRILDQHGALAELPELARRAAIVPEVLMGDNPPDPDLESALGRRKILCAIDDLIAEGKVERVGPRMFGPKKTVQRLH